MFEYSLKRSDRKTIGITVRDGKVYVRAPKHTSKESIEKFIKDNAVWIESKLDNQNCLRSRFKDYFDLKKFLFKGAELEPVHTKEKRLKTDGRFLKIPQSLDRDFKTALVNMYKSQARSFLFKHAQELSDAAGLCYNGIRLTDAKTKWGSCSSEKLIRLEWRLMFLPERLIDYVIIHELCHTKYMDHSVRFWNEVEKYVPDHKKRRKELKECGILIDLYR